MQYAKLNIDVSISLKEKLPQPFLAKARLNSERESKQLSGNTSSCPVIDGLTSDVEICDAFRSKLSNLLNSHVNNMEDPDTLIPDLLESLSSDDLASISIPPETVMHCLGKLGPHKSDNSPLSSNHLIAASPVLSTFLSQLFTIILRHGYMPASIRDCTIVPIPKSHLDPTSYRPIALASNLSKVLEHCILKHYANCFDRSNLQFGFKQGSSTTLCATVFKNVVSKYIHRGSPVFSCLLDASKAFDRVNHKSLLQLLRKRKVPKPILCFLFFWYQSQSLQVRWNSTVSSSFGVTNGVRQGGVLSSILFTVYMDELLCWLASLGIGCYSGHH